MESHAAGSDAPREVVPLAQAEPAAAQKNTEIQWPAPSLRGRFVHIALSRLMVCVRPKKRRERVVRSVEEIGVAVAEGGHGTKISKRAAHKMHVINKKVKQVMRMILKKTKTERKSAAAQEDVAIAFVATLRASDVGDKNDRDRRDVRLSRCLVAASVMDEQVELMEELLKECKEALAAGILISIHVTISFDEAKVVAVLPFHLSGVDADIHPIPTLWHGLVCRRTIRILRSDKEPYYLSVAMPIVPARDTSASTLFDGLYNVSQIKRVAELLDALVALGPKATESWGVDGAYPNDKLYAWMEEKNHKTRAMSKTTCFNHNTIKAEDATVTCLSFVNGGKHSLSDLFTLTTFIRMGSIWLRMVGVVEHVLTQKVQLLIGEPPAILKIMAKEVADFNIRQWRRFRRAIDAGQGTPEEKRRAEQSYFAYIKSQENHIALWNGPPGTTDNIFSYVPAGTDRSTRIKSMSKSFIETRLRSSSTTPEHGEWTRLFPSNVCVTACNGQNQMLHHILEAGSSFPGINVGWIQWICSSFEIKHIWQSSCNYFNQNSKRLMCISVFEIVFENKIKT